MLTGRSAGNSLIECAISTPETMAPDPNSLSRSHLLSESSRLLSSTSIQLYYMP